jgi:hypothetical protein
MGFNSGLKGLIGEGAKETNIVNPHATKQKSNVLKLLKRYN